NAHARGRLRRARAEVEVDREQREGEEDPAAADREARRWLLRRRAARRRRRLLVVPRSAFLHSPSLVLLEQRAKVVDRVRLGGLLVRAIALDTRKPQGDSARIARRGLDAVERDLDDELGAHEDGDPAPLDLAREQLLRLPAEQLVGHALERLADHDELAAPRVA